MNVHQLVRQDITEKLVIINVYHVTDVLLVQMQVMMEHSAYLVQQGYISLEILVLIKTVVMRINTRI